MRESWLPGITTIDSHSMPFEVLARERVLVLEAVRGEVAGDHDDVRLHLVHLRDRALEVLREEELRPAMEVGQLHDPEHVRGTLEDPARSQ